MSDKYSATWVSHSAISHYLACPRAYYLNNVYKDPKTGNKISLINPHLALGQAVHEVVESLSNVKTDQRFKEPLIDRFQKAWDKISGEKGGFTDKEQEHRFKQRGLEMIRTVKENPGPLKNLAVKIDMDLPHYWLSKEDQIILCGKIDWLEYLSDKDAVHIIDFKTGKNKESQSSLQLPIYHLLAHHTQKWQVDKVSYWYLQHDDSPQQQELPQLEEAEKEILKIAKKIKLARQLEKFECPQGGCRACEPLEMVIRGDAQYVGTNDYNADVYIQPNTSNPQRSQGKLL